MPSPFAAMQSRIKSACLAKFANVTAMIDGVAVDGTFDEIPDAAFGDLVPDTAPTFSCAESVALSVDSVVSISGTEYRVASVMPDGRGALVARLK
ncbi:hypothetical protein GBK02_09150 [Dechloromonas sp. TW-R-39-2]|uniref:head-tail joining protein n=1 Tax=Dechloromonas sp. TW-R-39-2 TaxID=2654218 RepID=UPI00193E1448|nr:hypothetical protein [Dechloromonas sp. TW-R-39-2]QRM19556.1 hypothetical protein GBK02_09150 [Dechloromonas sp. TW-R-39-2]